MSFFPPLAFSTVDRRKILVTESHTGSILTADTPCEGLRMFSHT